MLYRTGAVRELLKQEPDQREQLKTIQIGQNERYSRVPRPSSNILKNFKAHLKKKVLFITLKMNEYFQHFATGVQPKHGLQPTI